MAYLFMKPFTRLFFSFSPRLFTKYVLRLNAPCFLRVAFRFLASFLTASPFIAYESSNINLSSSFKNLNLFRYEANFSCFSSNASWFRLFLKLVICAFIVFKLATFESKFLRNIILTLFLRPALFRWLTSAFLFLARGAFTDLIAALVADFFRGAKSM